MAPKQSPASCIRDMRKKSDLTCLEFIETTNCVSPISTMEPNASPAVEVKAVQHLYKKGGETNGLHDVNMSVQKGTIYALLGPSGCGKTTLLCALVGLKPVQSGQVRIFNHMIGAKDSGVPGPWVGYMPQDLCLYSELTAEETLWYFGSLHRISGAKLHERIQFLMKLLDLPGGRQVTSLSGGQKRRLSLATSLVHDPPLLLMDEPTVGVDPILRKTIWGHLCHLSEKMGKTILITTHYIEEAGRADKVGFMRDGRILVEGAPQVLKEQYQVSTLEEVFTKLCMVTEREPITQEEVIAANGIYNPAFEEDIEEIGSNKARVDSPQPNDHDHPTASTSELGKTLPKLNTSLKDVSFITFNITRKNLNIIRRNLVFLILAFLSPLSNVLLIKCLIREPFGLSVAIVNDDSQTYISKWLINHLDKNALNLRPCSDLDQAKELLHSAEVHAVIHIGPNFALDTFRKIRFGLSTDNATLEGSTVRIYSHKDNLQADRVIFVAVFDAYNKMTQMEVQNLGVEPRAVLPALVFEQPVLGSEKMDHSDYLVMKLIPDSLFMMSLVLSALIFVGEKSSGLFDRNRVSGVSPLQILLSHFLILSFVTAIQISILVAFLLSFKIEVRGSYHLLLGLLYLASYTGMAFGIFISSLTRTPYAALLVVVFFYWMSGPMSGTIWPLEGQPPIAREITQLHPCNWNYRAVQRVITNGAGLAHFEIWRSVLLSSSWILALIFLALWFFRKSL